MASNKKIVIGCPMCGGPISGLAQLRGGCDKCDGINEPIDEQIATITKALQGALPYDLRIEMQKKYRELIDKSGQNE
jgi:hypothetical protein